MLPVPRFQLVLDSSHCDAPQVVQTSNFSGIDHMAVASALEWRPTKETCSKVCQEFEIYNLQLGPHPGLLDLGLRGLLRSEQCFCRNHPRIARTTQPERLETVTQSINPSIHRNVRIFDAQSAFPPFPGPLSAQDFCSYIASCVYSPLILLVLKAASVCCVPRRCF